jgi:AI-2 transport protein TqsA
MSADEAPPGVPEQAPGSEDVIAPTDQVSRADLGAADSDRQLRGSRREILSGPVRLLLPLALAAVIIFAMKYMGDILNPILLALFLTMGMSPALYWMRRKGVAPWLCVTIVSLGLVAVLVLFLLIMLSAVNQLDEKIPVYQENLQQMEANATAWLADHGIDVNSLTQGSVSSETAMNAVKGLLSTIVGLLGNIFWLILIVVFMVAEAYAFPKRLTEDLAMNERFAKSFANFSVTVRSFLFTKGWLSAIMAVIVTLIYLAFGTDFAVVWGILFFVLSFIPNIGFILSVIPPFFVTLLEFGFPRAATVVIIVIVINTIVDNMISPKIMGRSVGLSTLTVFLSVFFWGWVLGGLGALMSVPLTLMVKLLFFDSFDSTKTISNLMGTTVRELAGKKKRGKKDEGELPAAPA